MNRVIIVMALCLSLASCQWLAGSLKGDKGEEQAVRKYSDFLSLPHGIDGYFDFDEAVAAAKRENKPIFIDVTGHACNNCREMEYYVWSDPKVKMMLEEDFIICALYVDDSTKLDGGKQLGTLNSKLALEKWGVESIPAYIILSPDGNTILKGPRGYDRDIDSYLRFLSPSIEVGFDSDSPYVKWSVSVKRQGRDIYTITYDATFKEGYFGFSMSDFSAPYFDFDGVEILGDVYEPLTPTNNGDDELTGETSYIYPDRAVYVQRVRARAGDIVNCYIMATVCNKAYQCTANVAEFNLMMP